MGVVAEGIEVEVPSPHIPCMKSRSLDGIGMLQAAQYMDFP